MPRVTFKKYGSRIIDACVHRVKAGYSYAQVSSDLGPNIQTISKWCRERGVTSSKMPKKWTEEQIETLVTMWSDGASRREIAEVLGRKETSVESYVYNHRDICPVRRKTRKCYESESHEG